MTFTPPAEMSVMVQSRGSEPVPNWILAKLRHTRRSLVRRFANMSILARPDYCPLAPLRFYRTSIGIRLSVSVAIDRIYLNFLYRMPFRKARR
jgi:hypothetical protein